MRNVNTAKSSAMRIQESPFEAQDPSSSLYGEVLPVSNYNGPCRRRGDRRFNAERRVIVRFEISNSDRRDNPGRRHDDINSKFW